MRRILLTTALLAAPRAVWACPVCFGQTDSPLASAMNTGIMAMIGIVVAVLSGFAAFIVHLNRRARLVAGDVPTEIAQTTPQEGTAQC